MEDKASLTLFPASREQIREARTRTHVHWGRGLTLEQFVAKEDQLDLAPHAVDDKMTVWVLAPRNDPTTLHFKCACETYRRRGLVHPPNDLEPEEVVCYGVASVFTPAENRHKGYARHMMSLLHWVLAPRHVLPPFPVSWGSPPPEVDGRGNARFSILYSDVGDFYNFAGPDGTPTGWTVRDPISSIWDLSRLQGPGEDEVSDIQGLKYLDERGVQDIWKQDAAYMKKALQGHKSSRTAFTFFPDDGVAEYLMHWSMFFLPSQPAADKPTWFGVSIALDAGTSQPSTYATWTIDRGTKRPTLVVTRLRADQFSFPNLIKSVFKAARDMGMQIVEVWNLPKELESVAQRMGSQTFERGEHQNAFKWYGPEKPEEVEWLFNEKYAWC